MKMKEIRIFYNGELKVLNRKQWVALADEALMDGDKIEIVGVFY